MSHQSEVEGRDTAIKRVEISIFRVPTDAPESDGTLEWDSTTMVLVEIFAEESGGLGYTYSHESTADLIRSKLVPKLIGSDCRDIRGTWNSLVQSIRNLGRPGIASAAISAVDIALWDMKAKMLCLPLSKLLGQSRSAVPVYGSGGFTSYSPEQLTQQLGGWATQGLKRVKMKVGRHPGQDVERVKLARHAIGPHVELFVDANGAHDPKQALRQAEAFAQFGVTWFEEPVSSDNLEGLRLIRNRAPAGMDVSAGEYGYDIYYFQRMLAAGAVDVLQLDATRCGGITGFMQAASLAEGFGIPISAHTAPAVHLHPCCAAAGLRHLEYFHDHVRIEQMFFEGAVRPGEGALWPDLYRPGLGLELKRADMKPFQIS